MPEDTGITLEEIQAAAARTGITIGEDFSMMLPLVQQILGSVQMVPDDRLRDVEPQLVHDARRRGPT